MAWTPHVTTATVIQQGDQFLLVEERSKDTGEMVFNQPAGHVEAGETIIQAALRETLEETAWQVEITEFLGIYTYTPDQFPEKTYFRFCFLAKPIQETNHPLDVDITRAVWMTFDELKQSQRARSPLVIKAIEDALAGKHYPLSIIYELHPFLK